MKYLQVAMRRNGLHAIRGWCLNQLQLCPGILFDKTGFELEGISWFTYNIKQYEPDGIIDCPFVTLESFPIHNILRIKDRVVICHIRTFRNWLASSLKLTVHNKEEGIVEYKRHLEFRAVWCEYAFSILNGTFPFFYILYDKWVESSEYRRYCASKLGVEYDGSPYVYVHGKEFSSFDGNSYNGKADKMEVNVRFLEMQSNRIYRRLITNTTESLDERLLKLGDSYGL